MVSVTTLSLSLRRNAPPLGRLPSTGTLEKANDGTLLLRAGNQRLPLPSNTTFKAGDTVALRWVNTGKELQVQISPAATATDTAAAPPTTPAAAALAPLLDVLGSPLPATQASALVPPGLGNDAAAMRQVLALLFGAGELSADLGTIATLAQQAAAAGALDDGALAQVLAWTMPVTPGEAQGWQRLLERLFNSRGNAARLAGASAPNQDLASLLTQLRDQPAFRAFLGDAGMEETFDAATARVLDRLLGAETQQLHGLQRGYAFLPLPLLPGQGFERAHAHFTWSRGKGGGDHDHEAVLDLELTRLGPLWLQISATVDSCRCHARVANTASLRTLADAQPEAEAALNAAGFLHASFRVSTWDGNRGAMLASLLAPAAGLDVRG